jgi:hypothetical protein
MPMNPDDDPFVSERRRILTAAGALGAASVGALLATARDASAQAAVTIPSYAKAGLPAPGVAGRLARVSNETRGVWMDTGSQWFGVAGEVVNVREFGAKGDGAANDHVPIMDAIIAAAEKGGTVFFPPGTYLVNPGLDLNYSNVVLMGASPFASTIKLGISSSFVIDTETGPVTNVGIVNLGIDGSKNVQADASGGIGIYFRKVNKGFIRNCYIHDTARSAIVVGFASDSVPCNDIDVSGNLLVDIGLSAGGAGTDKSGIGIVNARRVTVIGNIIRNSVLTAIDLEKHGSDLDTLENIVVANNVIEAGPYDYSEVFGISVLGAGYFCYDITLTGNIIRGDGTTARTAIVCEYANRLTVNDNMVVAMMEHGMIFRTCYRAMIANNSIYGAGLRADNQYSGILVTSVNNNLQTRSAVFQIGGNIVESVNSLSRPRYGIDLTAGAPATGDSLVLGNLLLDYRTAAVVGGTNTTIAYNPA